MNKVILIGRLTRNPDVRYSPGGNTQSAVARYSLAVDRKYKRDGDATADFISCVTFGKNAEFAEKYLKKGMKVCVVGRLQTGSYEKDGQKIYTMDLIVEEHEFVESRNNSETTVPSQSQGTAPSGNQTAGSSKNRESSGNGFVNVPEGYVDNYPFI